MPYVVWQAVNGWPQLEVSRSIAAGGSGTSASRLAFLPFQLVLVSPWLAPVWLIGLVRLLRNPGLRLLGMLYPFLAVVFIVTGGKPYYIAGMYPFLLGVGSQPFVDRCSERRWIPFAAVALSLPAVVVILPVIPVGRVGDTPLVEVNYDAGETIGWPTYVEQVTDAVETSRVGPPDVILASNYGEAGALERFGSSSDLPPVYSGDNGYWYWGPPPPAATSVVAVGFTEPEMGTWCLNPHRIGALDNGLGVDNDEQGAPIWSCTSLSAPGKLSGPACATPDTRRAIGHRVNRETGPSRTHAAVEDAIARGRAAASVRRPARRWSCERVSGDLAAVAFACG